MFKIRMVRATTGRKCSTSPLPDVPGLRWRLHPVHSPHTLPSGAQSWLLAGRGQWEGEAPTAHGLGLPPPLGSPGRQHLVPSAHIPGCVGMEYQFLPQDCQRETLGLAQSIFFFLQSIFLQFNLKIGAAGSTCIKHIHFITVYQRCHNKIGVF